MKFGILAFTVGTLFFARAEEFDSRELHSIDTSMNETEEGQGQVDGIKYDHCPLKCMKNIWKARKCKKWYRCCGKYHHSRDAIENDADTEVEFDEMDTLDIGESDSPLDLFPTSAIEASKWGRQRHCPYWCMHYVVAERNCMLEQKYCRHKYFYELNENGEDMTLSSGLPNSSDGVDYV